MEGQGKQPPLWMPEGSVRACLTLLVVGSAVLFVGRGLEVPDWFIGAVNLVLGFYFGTRKSNGGGNGDSG